MRHNDNNRNDIDDDDDDDNVIIFITNEPFTVTKLRTNNVVKVTFFHADNDKINMYIFGKLRRLSLDCDAI